MALTPQDSKDIAAFYVDGQEIAELATAYNVTRLTVRNHLKEQGVKLRGAALPAQTDADLGIGVDDDPAPAGAPMTPEATLDAIVGSAAFEKLLNKAVEARLAQMGASAAPAATGEQSADFLGFMKSMERFVEAQEKQRPGYQKALSADELELRAEGLAEELALIAEAKVAGTAPVYVVGPAGFYGPTAFGPLLFLEGQEIRTYLMPCEDFLPVNDMAAKIIQADRKRLGEPTPDIAELIAQTMQIARGVEPTLVTSETVAERGDVELVDATAERHNVRPRRIMGTVVPESHGTPMPGQRGVSAQPSGPFAVGETA